MPLDPPHRKQLRRWERVGDIRFITFSCHHRLPLLRQAWICDLTLQAIARARVKYNFDLYAWVLMPEHVHLLVRPNSAPLAPALKSLKTAVSMRAIARWRESNAPILAKLTASDGRPRLWQKGGGFDRNVRDKTEFTKEVRYIHRNPVERGLAEQPEDWRWSSIHWWTGHRDTPLPCDPPPGDPTSWQDWLGYR